MRIKEILKIGLFIVTTSIFFAACANKPIEKNEKEPSESKPRKPKA